MIGLLLSSGFEQAVPTPHICILRDGEDQGIGQVLKS